ncbi:ArnT family glycosyltransferase [Aureibacter tunicatorum]|uniref:Glycosyltransferase RgtA/B/C/D-like domain-containing protein n=1 Tax=Aureibacter tunicatorum TaxID=866807 RepID=A0AAE3XKJ6_9BACT|nr:glycosyltransferase family 39 protein [Aureibacter tunicatorum]MDR6238220.1 hypothetical protein [Aureibacter tunicatorum]
MISQEIDIENTQISNARDLYGQHDKKFLFWSLGIWFAINIIQSLFTELHDDEAYYWTWIENLDWGFFDHPPMVALLIKAGYSIFNNELGVRLLTVTLGTLSIYQIWLIVRDEVGDIRFFVYAVFSLTLLQVYGFITTPDVPLFFFGSLFFLVYKKYLKDDSFVNSLLLAAVISLMLYSKYHAVLLVFFTLISNIKLLTKPSFWMVFGLSILLYTPHIYWQYANDFPTINYHLFGRSLRAFQWSNTFEFIGSQLGVLCFTGLLSFYGAVVFKPKNSFDRSLKFNFIGIFVFFLISTFKGRVEAHWTYLAMLPMVILGLKHFADNEKVKGWYAKLFMFSAVVFILMRIILIVDFPFLKSPVITAFHHWKSLGPKIDQNAKGLPVVFKDSFQKPSKYMFYGQSKAFVLNGMKYRKNHFDMSSAEDYFQGKDVYFVLQSNKHEYASDSISEDEKYYFGGVIENFRSYQKVKVIATNIEKEYERGVGITLDLEISNPYAYDLDFNANNELHPYLTYSFANDQREFFKGEKPLELKKQELESQEKFYQQMSLTIPEEPGVYQLRLMLENRLVDGLNSPLYKIVVK